MSEEDSLESPPAPSEVTESDSATVLAPTQSSDPPLSRAERRRSAETPRRRRWVLALAIVLVVGLGAGGAVAATGPHVAPATYHPIPGVLEVTQPGGSPPSVAWPAQGQGAWEVPAFKAKDASANQSATPIGSTTKMMSALVVLDAHPLSLGQSGPSLTVTPQDVADDVFDSHDDQSHAAVEVGEQLTELQLLQGLLVHSANNYALMLARWTSGSEAAFVVKMNEKAQALGLSSTHYADASGFDPASVSTAAEQIVVAKELMASAVLASIVKMTSVTLPVAGELFSYTPLLEVPGVVGVKSGRTTEAGGCDVMAFVSNHGGLPVMIFTAVMGQVFSPDRLATAGNEALRIAREVEVGIIPDQVAGSKEKVGEISFTTGSSSVVTSSALLVPGWPGLSKTRTVTMSREFRDGVPAGTVVGTVTVTSGAFRLRANLVTTTTIPKLSWWQRLI